MKILDENLFMLLSRIQENDRQFHTRTLDDGTVLVDVPGFGSRIRATMPTTSKPPPIRAIANILYFWF